MRREMNKQCKLCGHYVHEDMYVEEYECCVFCDEYFREEEFEERKLEESLTFGDMRGISFQHD